jgi:hypothetical protein
VKEQSVEKKTSRMAQGPRKHPPAIRYRVSQHGDVVEGSLLKSEAIGLYKHLRKSAPDDLVTVEAFAVPRHHSGKSLLYTARRGAARDVTNLFEKGQISKNSRKARLRRNADGGPNLLLWGGLAVGGYIAYRWLMGSKSDKASVSIAPVVGAKAPAMPLNSKLKRLRGRPGLKKRLPRFNPDPDTGSGPELVSELAMGVQSVTKT